MGETFLNYKLLNKWTFSEFHTLKSEIMEDIFRGSLISLQLDNFDTSKVTDMESMFRGCSNLQTLSLNSTENSKLQYMNKMYKNWIESIYLNFRHITTISFGEKHQMFYDCKKLNYYIIYMILKKEDYQLLKYSMMFPIILHFV